MYHILSKLNLCLDQDPAVSNPSGSSAQSWANIASQPPRVIQKIPKANTSSQVNYCSGHQHLFEHTLYKIDIIAVVLLCPGGFICTDRRAENREEKEEKKEEIQDCI